MTFRMPAEWEKHERTLIAWPCREWSWGETLEQGRSEFAAVANSLVEFEAVTMVCATEAQAADARNRLSARVEVMVAPMDGSWLRDNGPIFVTDGSRREARHFVFNAWGERHADRDRDARLGATLGKRFADATEAVDIVLEGGAVATDGAGILVAPEGCVMHPTRNWYLTRDQVEQGLKNSLGLEQVVWIPQGLAEDMQRDEERMYYGTDGHIDLFFDFIAPGECLLLSVPEGDGNHGHLLSARAELERHGIRVNAFDYMASFEVGGRRYVAPYLNFYVCNGALLVPVAQEDPDMDEQALRELARYWPGREIIAIPLRAGLMQGGGIHCLTQQVPAVQSDDDAVRGETC